MITSTLARSMRILHVIPSLAPTEGGPSYAVRRMAEIASGAGHRVTIATVGVGSIAGTQDESGVGVFRGPSAMRGSGGVPSLSAYLFREVPQNDVVHVHGVFALETALACGICRRLAVPYVLRPMGQLDPWSLSQKRTKKRLYYGAVGRRDVLGARVLHATSRLERDNLRRLEPAARCRIVPNSVIVPTRRGDVRRARSHALHVLFMSRLHPKKGVEALLDALAASQRDGVSASTTIAGAGEVEYESALRRRASELGLADCVRFVGFVDGLQKEELLDTADVFVLPSHQENFGVVVVEAMAHGVPVIVSDQVAIAPDILAADAGSVVAVDDRRGLAEAIASYGDATLRSRRGGAGRALAQQKFSDAAVRESLTELYRFAIQPVGVVTPV